MSLANPAFLFEYGSMEPPPTKGSKYLLKDGNFSANAVATSRLLPDHFMMEGNFLI